MDWKKKGKVSPVKTKTSISAGKHSSVLLVEFIFFICILFFNQHRTVNVVKYTELLVKAKAVYNKKKAPSEKLFFHTKTG